MEYWVALLYYVFITVVNVLDNHQVASIRTTIPCNGLEGSVTVPNRAQSWTLTLSPENGCLLENKALVLIPQGLNLRANGFCRGQLVLPGVMALNQMNRNSCFIYTSDRTCQTRDLSKITCKRILWIEKRQILPLQMRLTQEFDLPSTLKIKYSLIQCNSTETDGTMTQPPEPKSPNILVIVLAGLLALITICLILVSSWHCYQEKRNQPKADRTTLTDTVSPRNQECIYDVINEDRDRHSNSRQRTDVTITNILYSV